MASDTRERQRRRKVTLACEPCRERKSRCDGRKPICSTCEHRSLGLEQCIYKVGNARTASSDEYTRALHERIRQLEHACSLYGIEVDASGKVSLQPGSRLHPSASASASAPVSGPASRINSPSTVLSGAAGRHSGHLENHAGASTVSGAVAARTAVSAVTSPEQMDPENATGVTAMGTVLSEADLENEGATDSFYGRSSAASFLKEAASTLPQWQSGSGSASTTPAPASGSGGHGFFSIRGSSASGGRSAHQAQTAPSARQTSLPSAPALRFSDVDRFALPPRALADHFIQRFFSRVFYQCPFFDREAFQHAYQTLWQSDDPETRARTATEQQKYDGLGLGSSEAGGESIIFHCALNAIFALGCCFSDLHPLERTAAIDVFGNRSKSFVGLELINHNNLGVVQAMLVIAILLQGTPYPNRCWIAVGMACRVAQGIGLHTEEASPSRRLPGERIRLMRQRTWHGCVIMDLLVSMTFGRPPMTSSLSIAPDMLIRAPTGSDPDSLKLAFYFENVKLSVILEDILQRIYKPWLTRDANSGQAHHNLDTLVNIQGQLDTFERSVAPLLSWKTPVGLPESMTESDRDIMKISKNVLHARFIYMQLILYRPILSHLSAPDAASAASHNAASSTRAILSRDGLRYSFAIECGRSCVEAAKRLIVLVHGAYLTNHSDIWWWNGLYACAAGLVLIVARSCPILWQALDHDEISSLWDQSQSILQDQAVFSASARKSLDLLLKVNEHVLSKQGANGSENQAGSHEGNIHGGSGNGGRGSDNNGHGHGHGLAQAPISDTDESMAGTTATGAGNAQPGYFDFVAQMTDPNAPSLLEDTYAMGPLFTWDQNFDFSDPIP
ncbi:hypothetical protein SCUCBS95973_002770 [Sporothrix curviconia]|uniref:Zn(2)-C6 fungal-type domain-containing protein n=1 Tax=Sporothrix curviconia TaxID=1260050 RepID=A0ABP0B9P0_9PEZI